MQDGYDPLALVDRLPRPRHTLLVELLDRSPHALMSCELLCQTHSIHERHVGTVPTEGTHGVIGITYEGDLRM